MTCPPRVPAAFVGRSPDQLAALLTATQKAIDDLTTGGKVETASYAQGDGTKAVTFTKADLPTLMQRAEQLAGLVYPGQGYGRRRPLRVRYL
jgi:hypothetical protein